MGCGVLRLSASENIFIKISILVHGSAGSGTSISLLRLDPAEKTVLGIFQTARTDDSKRIIQNEVAQNPRLQSILVCPCRSLPKIQRRVFGQPALVDEVSRLDSLSERALAA